MEHRPDRLPERIPLFPLAGTVLLPRAQLPLNIFEPRYLAMVRDSMAGDHLIGMIQPRAGGAIPPLFEIGGLGRITQFAETDDGRFLIVLTGVSRFRLKEELEVAAPYRQAKVSYDEFAADLRRSEPLPPEQRRTLEQALRDYLAGNDLGADWKAIASAGDEELVNSLAPVCPFHPIEKQALLEAPDTRSRAAALIALMSFAGSADEAPSSTLQ